MVVLALVRLFDGELQLRELDALERCGASVGFESLFVDAQAGREETWDQWLLAESKRRIFSTVFLLDRVGVPPPLITAPSLTMRCGTTVG